MTPYYRDVLAYVVDELGGRDAAIEKQPGHSKLRFRLKDRDYKVAIGSTPSDTNAIWSARRYIRRAIGFVRGRVTGGRRARRMRCERPVRLVQTAPPLPDWHDQLRAHPVYRALMGMIGALLLAVGLLGTTASTVYAQSVTPIGAACDGVTNDYAVLQAALNKAASLGAPLHLPEGRNCHSLSTLVSQTVIYSDGNPFGNPPSGATISCPTSVSVCVIGTSGENGNSSTSGVGFRGVTVKGGQTAIYVEDTYLATFDRVQVADAAVGVYLQANSNYGIAADLSKVEFCKITDTLLVIDSWPETRGSMLRLGCNNDQTTPTNMIEFIGRGGNTPNTVTITNSQFNIGNGNATCWLRFTGITDAASEYTFSDDHVEGVTYGMCSDPSTTSITRLTFANNTILDNAGGHEFMALAPATAVNDWTWSNTKFEGWGSVTLSPNTQINGLVGSVVEFNGPALNLNGVGNGTVDLEASRFSGINVMGTWGHAKLEGIQLCCQVAAPTEPWIKIDVN